MYPTTTGYTHLPTARERLQNEIASCIFYMADNPESEYWADRFAGAMAQKHLDDLHDNQRACDKPGCFGTATGPRVICLDCWIENFDIEQEIRDVIEYKNAQWKYEDKVILSDGSYLIARSGWIDCCTIDHKQIRRVGILDSRGWRYVAVKHARKVAYLVGGEQ